MAIEFIQSNCRGRVHLTVRPANSKPSICSRAIFASSALLYLDKVYQKAISKRILHLLDEGIAFATASNGVSVQIDEVELSEGFEYLFDI